MYNKAIDNLHILCLNANASQATLKRIGEKHIMDINNLTKIIQLAHTRKINQQLKKLGYIDCEKHKKYKYISILDLFKGDSQETEEFFDHKGKQTYEGGIITNVKGYEQLEFIIININDDKHQFPIKMLVWAK